MTRFTINSMRKSPRKSLRKSRKSSRRQFPKTPLPPRFKGLVPPGINVRPQSVVVPVNHRKSILGQPAKVRRYTRNINHKNVQNGNVQHISVPSNYSLVKREQHIIIPNGYSYANFNKLKEVAASPKP